MNDNLVTTHFATAFDEVVKMTGEESYPIIGNLIDHEKLKEILKKCAGLHQHFSCIQKAELVRDYLGHGQVVIGQLLVWNKEMTANFGYFYNLPLEFHAWWEPDNAIAGRVIVDISLPGVIEKGLKTKDHIGYLIEGREPFILNGRPLEWTAYEPRAIVEG